ncbi:fluoride efflux transporter FluC [Bacillus cihuensis]|uniref:fluoride efflux transporter FluC n=1 Tax=Bacillus cihuensis TaxID=1208599 RepID=UPI00048C3381|nr:CrcB family protein [Bacillus cihuensis]
MGNHIWLIGFGGFVGAIVRYLVTIYFSRFFPIGTLFVNITGSFFMGILTAIEWLSIPVSLLVGTGFLGAYTTFSTLNFELLMFKKNRRHVLFVLYIISSYCLGLLSAASGYCIGKILFDG